MVAHKEVPGRPGLYGTTQQFLDYFNIQSLSEMPTLEQIQELDPAPEVIPAPEQEASEKQEIREESAENREASFETEPDASESGAEAAEAVPETGA